MRDYGTKDRHREMAPAGERSGNIGSMLFCLFPRRILRLLIKGRQVLATLTFKIGDNGLPWRGLVYSMYQDFMDGARVVSGVLTLDQLIAQEFPELAPH